MTISIDLKNILDVDYSLNDYEDRSFANVFVNLGFRLNDNDVLIYFYDMKNFKDAITIKTLLARIVYDILRFTGYNNNATLEYYSQ